jgi:cytochrome c5
MSTNDSHGHESAIKTPGQLITVIVLSFVVPIVLIVLLTQWVTSSRQADPAALTAEAVAQRIKPVADVALGNSAPASGPAAAGKPDGKKTYESTCIACHGAGVAGAPKFGDKAAWAPRIATGIASLYNSALKGKKAMPPKGGNATLGDADIKAAVDYLTAAAK